MAGYSKQTLIEKLGIKSGSTVYFGNAPQGYLESLGSLPPRTIVRATLKRPLDFGQFFTKSRAELEAAFPKLKGGLSPDGGLWISWPKGASGIATDLNENVVREIGLRNGLVDVKVCAVDDIWSGLKFVYRVQDRPGKNLPASLRKA